VSLISEVEISIDRINTDVFNYVSNMENFGAWFPGVISIISNNEKPHGIVGKKYLETVKVPLAGLKEIPISVVDSKQGEFFVTEGDFSPLFPRMEVDIKRINNISSKISWRMYSRNNNRMIKILLLPLAKSVMQKRAKIAINRLKVTLEEKGDV